MATASLISSEFLALCQGQLSLLVQGVKARFAIVYLTEEWLGGTTSNLVPVVTYPDNAVDLLRQPVLQLPAQSRPYTSSASAVIPLVEPALSSEGQDVSGGQGVSGDPDEEARVEEATHSAVDVDAGRVSDVVLNADTDVAGTFPGPNTFDPHVGAPGFSAPDFAPGFHQAVQLLYHDNQPVGVLVMARKGLAWRNEEHDQLERVAYTLSAACVMEHRLQWLQTRFQRQEIIQERQQDILDNLIHQFRNPLTALRTFGKLLVRRLGADDPNQRVAEGIVRESDRLQSLLTQMNTTVDEYGLESYGLLHGESEAVEDPDIIEGNWEPAPADEMEGVEGVEGVEGPGSIAAVPPGTNTPSALLPASPLTGAPLVLESCSILEIILPLLESFGAIAQEQGQCLRLCWQQPQQPPQCFVGNFAGLTQAELEPGLAELPLVRGNAEALREVLSNLISNALKYGHPQGTTVVGIGWKVAADGLAADGLASGEVSASGISLWVSDDGPGIPAADLPRLFERHYRGVQAEGNKPGSGLGLAIARSLVKQMGGQLTVSSPAGPWHPAALGSPTRAGVALTNLPALVSQDVHAGADPTSPTPGTAFIIQLWPEKI